MANDWIEQNIAEWKATGNSTKIQEVYNHFQYKIFSLMKGWRVGDETAGELKTEFFLTAMQYDATRGRFSTIVYSALKNRLRTLYQDTKRRQTIDLEPVSNLPVHGAFSGAVVVPGELHKVTHFVSEVLKKLTYREKKVGLLVMKGYTFTEIGIYMKRNPETIRLDYQSIIKKIKKYFSLELVGDVLYIIEKYQLRFGQEVA